MSNQNSINEFKKEDALVLFSGGQDSTTCLYWAKERFKNVYALSISYGQRHALEVDVARKIAQKAEVEFRVLDAGIFTQLASNSLIDTTIQMDEEKPENTFPNTFVPGRNMLFLTFAATIAYDKGIRHLVTGVSQADYSGYPDCRDSFIRSLNVSLNLAMDRQFIIHTPLMWRNKKQVWLLADELGIFDLVQHETLTCYNGIVAEGCGHCPACRLRKKGLEEYLAERL